MTLADDERLEAARAEGRKARAGIYTRMSHALDDDQTKVLDQERISRDLAAGRGLTVAPGAVYCDNNRSAWQRNRKRPGWDRMLSDIHAGKLDAIVVYHGDRLLRQPRDLELLLQLAEGKGIRILSVAGTRDLDSADDRFILRIEAAQACKSSDDTSRRKTAQHDRMRREGRVRSGGRGGRAFGYSTDGISLYPADRCDVATRRELTEAGVIGDMAARVLAGESRGSIARDVSAAGWRTPAGGEFTHGTIRKMLGRPRYAGLMPDGESAAAWPAILERDTWERVCAILDGKAAGFASATNARRWLLSGIATCGAPLGDGECGAAMQVKPTKGRGRREYQQGYGCPRKGCGRVYRSAPHLDAYVAAAVVAYLAGEGNPAPAAPADPGRSAEWAALQQDRAETQLALETAGAGSAILLARRLDSIDARIGQLREAESSGTAERLRRQYQGITLKEFRGLPLDVQRAIVAATVMVTVLPASRRGPGFRTEDVRVVPVMSGT